MKKLLFLTGTFLVLFSSCKKTDTITPDNQDNILSDSTIIVSNDIINNSLVSVDSTKLTFTATGTGVDKIKMGSILVSDISTTAPIGFLRKVTGISTVANNKVYTTEQASLTDAIVKGKVTFNKALTDNDIIDEDSSGIDISAQQRTQSLSFTFNYNQVVHDADGNNSTTYDQIKIIGEMKIEPTFDFELDIDRRSVNKFLAKITLKNTSKISAESKIVLSNFNKEIVLKTFKLKPFTIIIAGVPVPIAKQWIAIILGIDGNLTARITAGAQNINTAVAGISYQSGTWTTTNTQDNAFTLQPLIFEGAAKVEPWLQARYEIRPYGVRESRIYLGIKGSVIGEAIVIPTGLSTTLKWGIKFSAKAQMKLFHRSILDFESIFFEREFLIAQSNTFAYPAVTTTNTSNITQNSAQGGGNITSDGGSPVITRGVCWSTSSNPTIASSKTIDGTGTGVYISSITGLSSNTTYYLKAYATNAAGTAYGNEIIFNTIGLGPGEVLSPTGRIWMDRNLGASRVATSSDDHLAYGHLFQWGRGSDGHQLINWTGSTIGSPVNGFTTTLSSTNSPGHALFIDAISAPFQDWRNPSNDNLWQGTNGINNPCPAGFRLPTWDEFNAEIALFPSQTNIGAFQSVLKLPAAGRNPNGISIIEAGGRGHYWISTTSATPNFSQAVRLYENFVSIDNVTQRMTGACVRCIKD